MQTALNQVQINAEKIMGAIAAKIDSAAFGTWIAPMGCEIQNDAVVFAAQNQFSADYIKSVYINVLQSVAGEFGLNVRIAVSGAMPQSVRVANDNAHQSFAPSPTNDDTGAASFDAFVASDENAFVLSACKKVAAGAVTFSPLFIYGPAGCGKTFLTDCIENATSGRVIKMSGGTFVSEFARSLHDRTVFAFKDYCRNCDTFIIDDIQTLVGKRATCDEFLQLIMDLRNAGCNIVITSNVAPNNLNGFDRRMQSILASGLVADMTAPDKDARRVMLMRAGIASDVAEMISGRIPSNGHLVGGVIKKIRAYSELMGAPVNTEIAARLLSDTMTCVKTPIAMVKSMCEKLGVSYDAVCGRGRNRALVLARQTIMAVLKDATKLSLSEIGCYVGNRDHATVMYSISQIEKMKKSDLVLSGQISQLINEYK